MYDSTFEPTAYAPMRSPSRGGGFAAGFGLGLLVLPLTAVVVSFLGGGWPLTGLVAFGAFTAGAMGLPRFTASRAAGVVTAIAAEVAAGAGVVVWYLSTHEITFG